ncbi:MAG: hypothetical protein WKF43_04950 [Acidimicrobiales bacterium]
MTTLVPPDALPPPSAGDPPRPSGPGRFDNLPRSLTYTLIALGGVLLLTIVREITGARPLTGDSTFRSALQLSMPIALAGLGGLWAERAGVVNIGLEGMMILGTWFGAWGGVEFGAWQGVLLGMLGGAAGGLLHAVATVSFGVDHIVSGVAINLLGDGAPGSSPPSRTRAPTSPPPPCRTWWPPSTCPACRRWRATWANRTGSSCLTWPASSKG